MRYRIIHRTTYRYESPVTVSHYLARLAPRTLPGQECPWHEIHVRPEPVERALRADYFGNHCMYFEIEGSHHQLEVVAHSLVDVRPARLIDPLATPPWEAVREACHADALTPASACVEFCFASALVAPATRFAQYALVSFTPHRPVLDAFCDLNARLFTDFVFDPAATDIATPIAEVMNSRRGVCQDFAHVMIACLRSIGLPARYVSGYLETVAPQGLPKLMGADASHAWVSLFCGDEIGWMDADPTNNLLPSDRHVTVAWGRDFSDVGPLRGVTLGAGEQRLDVAVDVIPAAD